MEIAGTPAGTVMTPEYVAAIGRFAYVWGWPLVNNLNRSLGMTSVPTPGRLGGIAPVSPIGHVSMLTDYIDAGERLVTCPNQDTVYGAGFAHVDAQPGCRRRRITSRCTSARTGRRKRSRAGSGFRRW